MQHSNDDDEEEEQRRNVPEASSTYSGYCDQETLDNLSDDVGCLWAHSQIPVLDQPPSALTFLRDHVSVSRPCIIRNGIPSPDDADRPLILTLDDLVDICKARGKDDNMELTCDVTPDGHGDCIRTVKVGGEEAAKNKDKTCTATRKRMFVKPEGKAMSIRQFRNELRAGREEWYRCRQETNNDSTDVEQDAYSIAVYPVSDCCEESNTTDSGSLHKPVLYYSRQNDCLRTELKPLFDLNLFPQTFAFAEEAFATGPPDAVNLWIGDERAVSSMHKDHYENLFYVLGGEKRFTLCPPADIPFLHEGEFECGTFRFDKQNGDAGQWVIDPDFEEGEQDDVARQVRWIEPDIEGKGATTRFARLHKSHPIQVRISQGDMLYLPSLWYHRVTQSCETVGLNYWFDMRFDSPSWCYFNFLQHLKMKIGSEGI